MRRKTLGGAASKIKGSSFELVIAKYLNTLFKVSSFARTPGSGALVGKSNAAKRSGLTQSAQDTLRGDLITPAFFPYIVECKSYGTTTPIFHKILEGSDVHVDKWLAEVEFDCEQDGIKQPMLWFKSSRKGIFVAIPRTHIPIDSLQTMMLYRQYVIMSQDVFSELANTILPGPYVE